MKKELIIEIATKVTIIAALVLWAISLKAQTFTAKIIINECVVCPTEGSIIIDNNGYADSYIKEDLFSRSFVTKRVTDKDNGDEIIFSMTQDGVLVTFTTPTHGMWTLMTIFDKEKIVQLVFIGEWEYFKRLEDLH